MSWASRRWGRPREDLAGGGGFEPPLPGPEPGVLPLDDPPPKPTAPPTISQGPRPVQRTAVLSERLGLKRGTFAGGIEISFPVRGLRPLRAARLFTQNVPKPLIVTRRPLRSESKTALTHRFIFITGDTANREAYTLLADAGVPIVEKPFAPSFLLDAIRRVTISLSPSS